MYRQSFLKEVETKTCYLSNMQPENLVDKELLVQRKANKHKFFNILRSHQILNNIK